MPDDAALGKGGLSEASVSHLRQLLSRKELVKIRFADVEGGARKEFADEVCAAVGGECECVQILGRTMLLYRPNPELDPDRRLL